MHALLGFHFWADIKALVKYETQRRPRVKKELCLVLSTHNVLNVRMYYIIS